MGPIETYPLVGRGIYTIPEASRLTHVSTGRVRRWVKGYSFRVLDSLHSSPPILPGLPPIEGVIALEFLDIVEIRFVDAFLDAGVSWKALRLAHLKGREIFGTGHPFSTRKFSTDGRSIFVEVGREVSEPALLDLVKNQLVFRKLTMPFLRQLEFSDDDTASRWWPL